jgi:phospholipase D
MIKKIFIFYWIVCVSIGWSNESTSIGNASVCFSPDKECQTQIINEISKAKTSIKVQAYIFTDKLIGGELIKAKKRGVNVLVILDKINKDSTQSVRQILEKNDITVRLDCHSGIAHNKVMIIDDITVITGSYNFSDAAYKTNRENTLILHDVTLAKKYSDNFNLRWNYFK